MTTLKRLSSISEISLSRDYLDGTDLENVVKKEKGLRRDGGGSVLWRLPHSLEPYHLLSCIRCSLIFKQT